MVTDPVASLATQPTYGNGLMPSLNGWNAYATALPNGRNNILNSTVPTNANDTGNDGAMIQSSVEHRVRSGVDTDRRTRNDAQRPTGNGFKTIRAC
jgi:hypothetical protein